MSKHHGQSKFKNKQTKPRKVENKGTKVIWGNRRAKGARNRKAPKEMREPGGQR